MEIPVKALFAAEAHQVPAGHFFILDGLWFLAVKSVMAGEKLTCCGQLTGGTTGAFNGKAGGVATYIGGDYAVEVRVDAVSAHVSGQNKPWPASVLLGSRQIILAKHGHDDRFYYLDGDVMVNDDLADDRRRFVKWEGWLTGPDGITIGQTPLFSVTAV